MTKAMRMAAAAAVLTAGLGSVGCVSTGHGGGRAGGGDGPTLGDRYRNYVDPCYPERYNHAARQAVLAPFAQQVHNGHVLNQTVYTYHFEAGTDKLTPAGMEKLDSIARTRPAPDPRLYVQAAMDVPYTDATAADLPAARAELDAKRAAAIQRYLATVPTFAPVQYEVLVHNPATPGIYSEFIAGAWRDSAQGYAGNRTGGGATAAVGVGGGGLLAAPGGQGVGGPAVGTGGTTGGSTAPR